jgi:hypothetical protein
MAILLQVPDAIPPDVVGIINSFFMTVAVIALGVPIVRAFTKRLTRPELPPPATSPDVIARLERIEQAVDTVAIEVERIAESQRFTAKLMAGQQQRVAPPSSSSPT